MANYNEHPCTLGALGSFTVGIGPVGGNGQNCWGASGCAGVLEWRDGSPLTHDPLWTDNEFYITRAYTAPCFYTSHNPNSSPHKFTFKHNWCYFPHFTLCSSSMS